MKKYFTISLLTGLLLATTSCKNSNSTAEPEKNTDNETSINVDDKNQNLLTDEMGRTLSLSFDNDKEEVSIIFENDTLLLKQDKMASGIKYSNEEYVYTEHQGESTLTKNGKVVFEKK